MLDKKTMVAIWKKAMEAKDRSYEAVWDDGVSEEEFDAICEAEDKAMDQLQKALISFCHGALGKKEAYMLARFRTEDVGKTLARMA